LFLTFNALVRGGTPAAYWPDIALKTQQVMDACLESARKDGVMLSLG